MTNLEGEILANWGKKEDHFTIEVKNLKKYYHEKSSSTVIKAIDGISFNVKKGKIFGLLGPNGAGKTTLISILTGIISPTDGNASIDQFDVVKNRSKIKEIISLCPQEPALYKFLSGVANIEFFAKMYLLSNDDIMKRSEDLLKSLGLYEHRNRKVNGYSGGMLRQLSLIVSLINDPDILFLDEPTVGMDPRNRRKVWNFLQNIKNGDETIILTTHYIEEAEALCDRVAIIDYGKLIALGSPSELIDRYHVKNLEEVFMEITGRSILEGLI